MADIDTDSSALDHAAALFARTDTISGLTARDIPVRGSIDAILDWLRAACLACSKADAEAGKAAEWLLDNDYIVHRALRQIKQDLPAGFYRKLPALSEGTPENLPRIFVLAHRCLELSRMQISAPALSQFMIAYQQEAPLRIGELWAFPTMLRIACIEILVETLSMLLCDHLEPPVHTTPWAQETHGLEENERVARAIANLGIVDAISWEDFFDSVSSVEQILSGDPSGFYARMDFDSRDRYRRAVEELAQYSRTSETEIAERAVEASRTSASHERTGHVGYWLVGEGRRILEGQIETIVPTTVKLRGWVLEHASLVYFTLLFALLAGALLLPAIYLRAIGADLLGWLAGLSLSLVPASVLAITLLHWAITRALPPRVLFKLDCRSGLPPDCQTLVAVPVVLAGIEEIPPLVEKLENHWLSNRDPSLEIALLADLADAPCERTPADEKIEQALESEIEALNARYGDKKYGPFHLLLRPRQFSPEQGCWLAWERKRGKLEQLNRMLIQGDGSAFHRHVGTHELPRTTRFVVTLDADTTLPTDVVKKLVGTLAHPLNQPDFDPATGQLRAGYTIIQPRVEISPESGSRTLFARLFAGDTSIDIYSRAVSNVYQDLFGAGIFVGKGIYDLNAFHRSLTGRVPENTILSHDLFEGAHGRAGLASDIVLFERFPGSYLEYARRAHRWIRGDWQLLPWLARKVQGSAGVRSRNPIRGIERWKIVDNLRRSLVAPTTVLLAVSGWLVLPGQAWFWSLLAFFMPAGQLFTDILSGLAQGRRRGSSRSLVPQLRDQAGRWFLALVYLLNDALVSAHAIGLTLWRVLVSRRKLLEWTSAAHSAAHFRANQGRSGVWRKMWAGPAITSVLVLALAWFEPAALVAALPLLVLWIVAPEITLAMARQREETIEPLAAHESQFLRKLARKSWLFFETFAGPEDNWLPPDNYQGAPHEEIAKRTSPTNIGMLLLSTAAAWDLGYIGRAELAARTANLFATLDRLERYRGHFYNWYHTRTLAPLEPRYVSTVDSGNLAAAFVSYASALREAHNSEGIEQQRWTGLGDVIGVIDDITDASDNPTLVSWSGALRGRLEEIVNNPDHWGGDLEKFCETLIPDLEAALGPSAGQNGSAVPTHVGDLQLFADRLLYQARSMCRDIKNGRRAAPELLELADKARGYADAMAFGPLYDKQRRLLRIGINVSSGRPDPHYYDLLASEARLASFFAIAQGDVPPEHWFHLGRPLRRVGSGTVLVSWNGSMFEYLMPRLLLKPDADTLLGETERIAVEVQRQYGIKHRVPWGISESAYAARDPEHRYRYQGFGVPELGFKRGLAEDMVVAPYAAALALAIYPKRATQNLIRLAEEGAEGRYGVIEALDFTRERSEANGSNAVNAYMAHHQGMLLSAIVNALSSDILVRRFTQDARMRSTLLLLSERVPKEIPPEIERLADRSAPTVRGAPVRLPASWQPRPDASVPQMLLLGNGPLSAWNSDSGSGTLRWHHRALTRFASDATRDADGSWIYIADEEDGELWSATLQPTALEPQEYRVTCHAHMAEYHRRDHGVASRLEIGVLAGSDIEVRRLRLINEMPRTRTLRVTSYAEVVLGDPLEDERHPAFSKLFVSSEHIPALGGLLFQRRARGAHETPPVLLHAAIDEDGPIRGAGFETDRRKFVGRNGSLRSPPGAKSPLSDTQGWTLDPIMALQREIVLEPFETREICFLTIAAAVRDTAVELAERHATLDAVEWAMHDTASDNARIIADFGINPGDLPGLQQVTSKLVYPVGSDTPQRSAAASNRLGQSGLWGMGLSGDHPILLLRSAGEPSALLDRLLAAHRWWRRQGLQVDLVILQVAGSSYVEPVLEQLRASLQRADMSELLGHKAGVHVVFADQIGADQVRLLESTALLILDDAKGSLTTQLADAPRQPRQLPLFSAARAARHSPTEPLSRPTGLHFDNGVGGFSPDWAEYVIYLGPGESTPSPWCNILANREFGTLVSEAGGGFTWSINSGENRLTTWSNDPVSDRPSESLYLRDEETGEVWTITPAPAGQAAPCEIRHGTGYSTWTKRSAGLGQKVKIFVPPDAPVKIIQLRVENLESRHRRITATYFAEWLLGSLPSISRPHIVCDYDDEYHVIMATSHWNDDFSGRVAFLASSRSPHGFTTDRSEFIGKRGDQSEPEALRRWGLSDRICTGGDTCGAYQVHLDLAPGATEELIFVLGQGSDKEAAISLARHWREVQAVEVARTALRERWDDVFGAIQVSTPDPAFDLMVNRWLLYQTLSSRFLARSGFYQSSGAYGFRDQLQDVLALLDTAPELARSHILESARHQFVEGDVLHWWHPPSDRGVRTRFSDDLLWLPYVVAGYVEATGDVAILKEEVPFLDADELAADEHSRYGQFETTEWTSSLFDHCERSLERASRVGAHGLPLIGSGDWNDGMDRLGARGQGESVWLAWFIVVTSERFAGLCRKSGREAEAEEWMNHAAEMRRSAEAVAWDGAWYRRAFDDDGRPVGSAANDECQIDSIAQSWAAFASADGARVSEALQSAWDLLVSQEDGLARLLWPAFDKGLLDPGYIKAYPPGVRENGGQYSHAAAWLAMAFSEQGDPEKAFAIFDMINPVGRSDDAAKAWHYRLEPYSVAGDISSGASHSAEGGWSGYTGAAGWAWQLATRNILGLRQSHETLTVRPCIPPSWGGFRARIRANGGTIDLTVDDPQGLGCGSVHLTVNGRPHPGNTIALPADGEQVEVVALIVER
ncbi:cellobiose phosphorylase [Aurantiacibacter atlanticus]|uniref:Cellobiose phosphorylase n=1 Tax=Aurantiacibacter atlanticus TaxID=1648404 RepID=A0A0H4VEU5_9SPHN|nr:glucoamylase family protein [Aurantiacibacter atlanticus]AKQ41629.1 cellobiose phosphorylase [Aurantiacibacter atlanticus]